MRPLLLSLALGALSACSAIGVLDSAAVPLAAYELRPAEAAPVAPRRSRSELLIAQPTTSGALDTERILIRPSPLEAQYLPGAQWTAITAEMVQTVLVRQFDRTAAFSYVGRAPLGAVSDFSLLTEIVALEAEVAADGAVLTRVSINATLLREDDLVVLSTRTFEAVVPAADDEAPAITAALDDAMQQVLVEMTGWVLGRLGIG